MNVIISVAIGLTGSYLYLKVFRKNLKNIEVQYVKAFVVLAILGFILYFFSAQAATINPGVKLQVRTKCGGPACNFCNACGYLKIEEIDELTEIYKECGKDIEYHYNVIQKFKESDQFNGEDLFVNTVVGAIASVPVPDLRAKVITIALANAAEFFRKNYYYHQKIHFNAAMLAANLYLFNKIALELKMNRSMCQQCAHLYYLKNYEGDNNFYINTYPPTAKSYHKFLISHGLIK